MSRLELEAALRDHPDDERLWAVLGDLLTTEGDPRGELIALEQRAAATTRAFEREVLRHRAAELSQRERPRWLGPLASTGAVECEWRRGFIVRATIHRRVGERLRSLLELPATALMRALALPRARGCTRAAQLLAGATARRIEVLDLAHASCTTFAPLAELMDLRELGLASTQPDDLAALASLSLRELDLSRAASDLRGLAAGFAALESLRLTGHPDPDELASAGLEPLAGLTALRELQLGEAGWRELDPLAGLQRLERLVLSSTDVFDLAPLVGMTQLRELDVRGCYELADLGPLAGLRRLEVLRLGYTRVRDLGPLRELPRLRHLDLSGTAIRDVNQLLELPGLERVEIHGSDLREVQPLLDREIRVDGRPPVATPSWRDLAEGLTRFAADAAETPDADATRRGDGDLTPR